MDRQEDYPLSCQDWNSFGEMTHLKLLLKKTIALSTVRVTNLIGRKTKIETSGWAYMSQH